ncbi:MAG: glutamate synthase small subunit, partial [Gammaproteobacteria bacterium]|nr:glutamate synthase small subunit [Gammaproteobacteria bacterium]
KVAVVGSGPAGLAAAAQLNRAGHEVTVIERADRPGGLLMYGIPNMKLAKEEVVLRRIRLLEEEGVRFRCNTEVADAAAAKQLRGEFDAVVLCTGATQPRDLPVEGRQLAGVHFAMDYLTDATKAVLGKGPKSATVTAKGLDVVVIGGGDTGTDCVGSSMRQGCRTLTQFEIMEKPPLERADANPWPEWPRVYKMDYGQEEAAAKFGKDPRAYLTTVKKFVGDESGHVKEIVTVEVHWEQNGQGQFVPVERPGTEKTQPAQLVLLAMGFTGPEAALPAALGLELDARKNVKAEYGQYATSVQGVFAAGDCRRGQSLVVWAINEGRGAARECDRFLMGRTELP